VSKSFALLMVFAATAVSTQALCGEPPAHGAAAVFAAPLPAGGGSAMIGPVIQPTGAGSAVWASHPDSDAQSEDWPKTAIDYRLAPAGLGGSVGYLCVPDHHPFDYQEITAASSRVGRESSLLGATLRYAFK